MKLFWVPLAVLFVCPWGGAYAYDEIEVKEGGTIYGRVTFAGPIPDIPAIRVIKNQDFCGQEVWDPVLVVNPSNRGLKNTIVYLNDITRGKPLPVGTTISVFKCLFVPHATVIFKNRPTVFYNNDMVFHNVHAFKEQGVTLFNAALPSMGKVVSKKIKATGVISIRCDSHAHMNGWAISLDHPYFSVTDEKGRFKISDVPPGEYTLVAWHEGYVMVNRSAYETALETPGNLLRPMYDAPHVMTQPIVVKSSRNTQVKFALSDR